MRNVIIITTDQQRYDTLSCNGSTFIHTPNLDSLASQGARFERAYCTNPVCTPSRVSIMTGKLPSRHGSYNIGTVASDTSAFLSSVLTGEGYRTHQLGKAHFYPWDTASFETRVPDHGEPFYDFAGFETAELSVGHSDWGVSGHYENWLNDRGIRKGHRMPQLQVARLFEKDAYQTGDWGMPVGCHSGAWIMERTEAFLRDRAKEKPFYLNIGFQDPHHPLAVPAEWTKPDEAAIPLPEGTFDPSLAHIRALSEGTIEQEFGGRYGIAGNQNTVWKDVPEQVKKKVRSYYYAMAELFDRQMGELISLLHRYGVFEDTLLIVTSDHGDMLFDHGIGEKGPVAYEEVLKVPLLMVLPGCIRQQTVSEPVSLADLYPTVLDYLGISVRPACDGLSLRPLLEGGRLSRKGISAEFIEEKDAIRYRCFITDRWKLVEYPGECFGELYDLRKDPKEAENLWADPRFLPDKYELLRCYLYEMQQREPLMERPCRC